jgi:hypothetical protein
VHAIDPQWRQDVICSAQVDTMQWERWTGWRRGDPRWHVHVLDTTHLAVEQAVDRIVAWVRAGQAGSAGS